MTRQSLMIGCVLTASLMVCGTPAMAADVFYEAFGTTFPPTGWTISNLAGTAVTWKLSAAVVDDNLTGGAGGAAMIYSSGSPRTIYNAALVTPTITLPASGSNLRLRFRHLLETWSGDEIADVDISTDGGTIWTNLWRRKNIDRELALGSVPLSSYLGRSVKFRFRYYNTTTNAWDLYWQIDEVRVANVLAGDINVDNYVNVADLQQLVTSWASSSRSGNWNMFADLVGDGYINVGDLQVLVANWGQSQ